MKRIMTLAVVIFLLLPPATMFGKERRGAQIMITKTDEITIVGELIAIKQYSKLLFESSSGIGESINVSEIESIKIARRPLAGVGAFFGMLLGAYAGGTIGYGSSKPHTDKELFSAWMGAFFEGTAGFWVGLGAGAAIGSLIPIKQEYRIEGKPLAEIIATLDELRSEARFPKYE